MLGRPRAQAILADCTQRVSDIAARTGTTPTLSTVVVGSSQASATYVRQKRKMCDRVGIASRVIELPGSTTTAELLAVTRELAEDPSVHGILIQHPVPSSISKQAAFEAIPHEKDVDGVASGSMGKLILGMPTLVSCTPAGILDLLTHYGVKIKGRAAVVIGRSPILGRPMAALLINGHATVTLCHSHTQNLDEVVRQADILIVAVGRARFVQGSWIKSGAVVVDAGYNEGNIGDVDFDSALQQASLITPVPGGVGPMTIATLMRQTTDAAAISLGVPELGSETAV